MLVPTRWEWSSPKGQRKLHTVEDHLLCTYSMLVVTRR